MSSAVPLEIRLHSLPFPSIAAQCERWIWVPRGFLNAKKAGGGGGEIKHHKCQRFPLTPNKQPGVGIAETGRARRLSHPLLEASMKLVLN